MKKIIKKLSLASVAVLAMSSCDDFALGESFLEQPLGGEMNIDSVYSKRVYAEQHLSQVYHSLPDFMPHSNRLSWGILESITDIGDHCKGAGSNYHTGTINSASSWDGFYSMDYGESNGAQSAQYGFRQAQIFLANIDRVPDSEMSAELKNRRKGEAKLIMAYHYVDIFRSLGGMPWIDKYYTAEDDMNMTRLTLQEMEVKICTLIDEAAALLPWTVVAEDAGRMTKAGALALKSRLLTFAASPLYNDEEPYMEGDAAKMGYVWYGNKDQKRWQNALDAGLAFLRENKAQGNAYKLADKGNPRKSFRAGYFDRHNGETLIEGHRFSVWDINSGIFNQIRYRVCCPTSNYMEMFEMKDGTDFDWNKPEHRAHPFFTEDFEEVRDPRLYETLIVTGDRIDWTPSGKAEIYKGGAMQAPDHGSVNNWRWAGMGFSGMGIRKFFLDHIDEVKGQFYCMPLIRLPEIYLNIAEAMNELGKASTADEFGMTAYDYVNLVRSRVGMPGITPEKIQAGVDLREAILRERAVEFGFEECRWYDISRWKHSDYLDPEINPVHRFLTEPEGPKKGDHYVNFTYKIEDGMAAPRKYVGDKWSNKYYLCPIPLNEINKKFGLIQNPGW